MEFHVEEGSLCNGQRMFKAVLTAGNGSRMEILNYGGIVHAWYCPDRNGKLADVLLGCRNPEDYLERHPYFGTITGRYANRIRNGVFTLDGKTFQLSQNLPPHHLHGGFAGLDRKLWEMQVSGDAHRAIVRLTTTSPHMEEGYPGNLEVSVTYTFSEDNALEIEYDAITDRPTVINLTNHCYFNLSGGTDDDIKNHQLYIRSQAVTETDQDIIPTGQQLHVLGTMLDFNDMRSIGEGLEHPEASMTVAHGYDHNYILDQAGLQEPVAEVRHMATGRVLKVYTDQPGMQLYTGNWLEGVPGKEGMYSKYSGFCLETQHFPDSPNQPSFPDTTLRPGERFYSKTVYELGVRGS
jgi:aldose 1-epimerase